MAVRTVLVIEHLDMSTIAEANSKFDLGNKDAVIQALLNHIRGCKGGVGSASIQVTVRDTDPAVATNGSGSTQNTYVF